MPQPHRLATVNRGFPADERGTYGAGERTQASDHGAVVADFLLP